MNSLSLALHDNNLLLNTSIQKAKIIYIMSNDKDYLAAVMFLCYWHHDTNVKTYYQPQTL